MKVVFAGQFTVGGTVSINAPALTTMALNVHEAWLPVVSTAEYVNVVRPTEKVDQSDVGSIIRPLRCRVTFAISTLSVGVTREGK